MTLHEVIYKRLQDIDKNMGRDGIFPEYIGIPQFKEYLELVEPLHQALVILAEKSNNVEDLSNPPLVPSCDSLEQYKLTKEQD